MLRMRKLLPGLFALLIVATAQPAYADLTGFIGITPTPSNRQVRGVAAGVSLVIVGFEFEYADTVEDEDSDAPGLTTGMAAAYVQTPLPVNGIQPYAITGAGFYRERLGEAQETHVGVNVGGGVKISLAGPLRIRIDYRVFTLRGDPLHSRVHRIYTGLNLAF